MAIGRISGAMLKNNLERYGTDLAFETDLLYLDVVNGRVGIKTDAPTATLQADNVTISGSEIRSTSGPLDLGSTPSDITIGGGTENYVLTTDGSGNLSWNSIQSIGSSGLTGIDISLGDPTDGDLETDVAVILSNTTAVTDAIDSLNEVLGKLVPTAPGDFPRSQTLSISSLSTYRMCDFTQTDNTDTGGRSVAGGTSVSSVRRSNSYSTNTIGDSGPGDSGNVTVYVNGLANGTIALDSNNNAGTNNDLIISDNVDYGIKTGDPLGFWQSFDARATGTVTEGWNEVYIDHDAAGTTNTAVWYYDASSPGTPQISNTVFAVDNEDLNYSSSVPHYTSNTTWNISFDVNRLSGDMYPTSDTFVTGSAGGAFSAPTSVTYSSASITTPLARNLYVSSGSATVTTSVTVRTGHGSSSASPSVNVTNSYATGSGSLDPSATVLYMTGSSTSVVDEDNILVNSVGGGSGNAIRVSGTGTGDTPDLSGATIAAWDGENTTLETYEGTVVAGVASHDTTDYSTGYLPIGPDLSSGRTGTQYITFRFARTTVSKFDIQFSGKVSGCQVAMPGSELDNTSSANGWIDPTLEYAGSGVPGDVDTGSNSGDLGCGLSGTLTTGSTVTNESTTVTFGTESSTNSTNNYIYVRFKLESGDSITSLQFKEASN